VLAAGGTLAAAGTLAACGGGNDDEGGSDRGQQAPGKGLVALDKVPVRGAVSATGPKGEKLIVARPDQDTAVAFSAICTHQGCTVAPAGSQLHCPCHGSVYDALTGKNISGPAPRPLASFAVRVKAGEVVADGS
jgi:Rieske Fe-S protein